MRNELFCCVSHDQGSRRKAREGDLESEPPRQGRPFWVDKMEMAVALLVVEDEPLILLAIQDALEDGGYTVITAGSGQEAMEILESRRNEISGMITDIRLGSGPDGWKLARHARELKPNMPVVYATGDSAHEWPSQGVPKSLLMQKPYAAAQAVSAISTLLTKADSNSIA